MKRLTAVLLALLLILSMAACGKNNNQGSTAAPANNSTAADKTESAATDKPGTETTMAAGEAGWAMIPGTLNYVNLKEGAAPVLKGLRLYGNRIGEGDDGSGKGFNYKPASTEDIRCIFALGEWVEIYPDTEETNLVLLIFNHLEDQSAYETLTFSDAVTMVAGYVAAVSLEKPESSEDPWGSFYLNEDDNDPGYYDFVFVAGTKPVATLLTRFYLEDELDGKSDAELEQIQKGLEALQVK